MLKKIEGIVRHYHVPNSDHTPYRGILKTMDDREDKGINLLSSILSDFLDGEAVTITIEGKGKAKAAKNHVWMWTKAHTYERKKESAESKDPSHVT